MADYPVDMRSNDRVNQCMGTSYYRYDPNFSESEILDAINECSEVKAVDIYRMKKKVDSQLVELPISIR